MHISLHVSENVIMLILDLSSTTPQKNYNRAKRSVFQSSLLEK